MPVEGGHVKGTVSSKNKDSEKEDRELLKECLCEWLVISNRSPTKRGTSLVVINHETRLNIELTIFYFYYIYP